MGQSASTPEVESTHVSAIYNVTRQEYMICKLDSDERMFSLCPIMPNSIHVTDVATTWVTGETMVILTYVDDRINIQSTSPDLIGMPCNPKGTEPKNFTFEILNVAQPHKVHNFYMYMPAKINPEYRKKFYTIPTLDMMKTPPVGYHQ